MVGDWIRGVEKEEGIMMSAKKKSNCKLYILMKDYKAFLIMCTITFINSIINI